MPLDSAILPLPERPLRRHGDRRTPHVDTEMATVVEALLARNIALRAQLDVQYSLLVELQSFAASVAHALRTSASGLTAVIHRDAVRDQLAALTRRQREVLRLVVEGHPSKRIALQLGISQRTVENHRASIMTKTGATSVPALTQLAMLAGVGS